jgi:oligopeptide/dipeptide ABC transporter ATP-binding protein
MKSVLVHIQELKKYFTIHAGFLSAHKSVVKAVDGVSLHIFRGETLGLVGESGCGKSTLGRLIMRLEEPTAGKIFFEGENIFAYAGRALQEYRKKVQIIFQDPYSSLNPRRSAGSTIGEPLLVHHALNGRKRQEEVHRIMALVGLSREHAERYPHEFSGGQRQRIGIARAVVLTPQLIIADEPVSALDVSIQAQILNLLKDLQKELELTYLFITHDLSVVRHMSDRIAVMYFGRIVELAANEELYNNPLHPYTMALLSAVPTTDPEKKSQRMILKGELPNPAKSPEGCPFHLRCSFRIDICDKVEPKLNDKGEGHFVACHIERS